MSVEILALVGWPLCSILTAVVARKKGRSGCGWFTLGVFLGPFGLFLALIVTNRNSIADVTDVPEDQSYREETGLQTTTLHSEITEACKRADIGLWEAFARSAGNAPMTSGICRLIFPQYRDGRLRVSEQEARFAFVESLSQGPLKYSIEAPTSKLYSFSGKTPLSAQTDLQLHYGSQVGVCNVEFKAKGVSLSAQDNFPIYKDVQKLLREPVWGLWFHLLERVDKWTIIKFLSVLATQIVRVQSEFAGDVQAPGLTIHVCVLQPSFSLQKDWPLPLDEINDAAELERLLSVDLHAAQFGIARDRNSNGWAMHAWQVADESQVLRLQSASNEENGNHATRKMELPEMRQRRV